MLRRVSASPAPPCHASSTTASTGPSSPPRSRRDESRHGAARAARGGGHAPCTSTRLGGGDRCQPRSRVDRRATLPQPARRRLHRAGLPGEPPAPVVRSMPAYASVLEIPGPVDLAVIVVPAPPCWRSLEECAREGRQGAGRDLGRVRRDRRRRPPPDSELLRRGRARHGMRMVGPNCMGVLNTDPAVRLDATFAPVSAAGARRLVVAERRARARRPRPRRPGSGSASPPSSPSATRPTSRATTCCSTGRTTRPPT